MADNIREKLVELLDEVQHQGNATRKMQANYVFNSEVADHLIANGVTVLPCKEGDTVYVIRKFCDQNTGYKEFYRPSKEFDKPCQHYEPAEWECGERCIACADIDFSSYCSLNLNLSCDECKERIAIQADKFNFSMMCRVFNTPMFDEKIELVDTLFLTKREAEQALKVLLSMPLPTPPKGE